MTPGLFYAKSDLELHTKVEENSPMFPTVIYKPSNSRRFTRYNFWTMMELLKTVLLPRSGASVRKMTPGLFYAKPELELHTKVEENSPRFPTVIYKPANGRRFTRYNFWTTTELLKTVLWTHCSVKRKLNSGPDRMGFFPWDK
jgi:hypothetical protein